MLQAMLGTVAVFFLAADRIETQFVRVAPALGQSVPAVRSAPSRRAVILVHGLRPHPFNEGNAQSASLDGWQKPGSRLVAALARDGDVFAFAYSQNASVDQIAACPAFGNAVREVRAQGYAEIILVGHSAGGVLAREFVEDHPEAGVTKVIQVCAPNRGSALAEIHHALLTSQSVFLQSLTREGRNQSLRLRTGRRIPDQVQFGCIVGVGEVIGDGVVFAVDQWPPDLQWQGIPAIPVYDTHSLVVRVPSGIARIAELVRTPLPRWSDGQVALARHKILHQVDPHLSLVGPGP